MSRPQAPRRSYLFGLPFWLFIVTTPAAADPTGLWWAEGGAAQVRITNCGGGLCADVAWLRSPFDINGCPLRDDNNPDPALRQRQMIGTRLLEGLQPRTGESGRWEGGRIYDPTSGRTYRATMTLESDDRMLVRGYLGFEFIGRTTTWIRVGGNGPCDARETALLGDASAPARN
jgi:uncharacterized protein (DUF2147 family)